MKKKAALSATALAVLASAAIPVHTTPVEASGDIKVLQNPPSKAQPAVNKKEVYTSFTSGVTSNIGNGSENNPYNRFEDAVANVEDGGVIYVKGKAFLNDVGNNLPFLIDKNITIKSVDGTHGHLEINSAGILLGKDVKFENLSLNFGNRYHDSIFANGHRLDLINVSRSDSAREFDLFAGGLYDAESQIHPSGNKGIIHVETNGKFTGGNLTSKLGNIYAGSMNGPFNGDVEISVARKDKSKKLEIGSIKGSGALEAYVTGNFFDLIEPDAPAENAERFPVNGNVSITLDDYQVSVHGKTGSEGKSSVTTNTVYPNNLELKDVNNLSVTSGHIKLTSSSMDSIDEVTLDKDTKLDLTMASKDFTVGNFNGNGAVVLNKEGKLNITNQVTGSLELKLDGEFGNDNGEVLEGHTYITTPTRDASISFTPRYNQTKFSLVSVNKGSHIEWVTGDPKKIDTEPVVELEVTGFNFEDGVLEQTKSFDEINDKSALDYATARFPFTIQTNRQLTDDDYVYLEDFNFDVTVNGKPAEYRELMNDFYVEELGLSLYFNSETNFDEHELVVLGLDADGIPTDIDPGNYKISVTNDTAQFKASLVVPGEEEITESTPETEVKAEEETQETPVATEEVYLSNLDYVKGKTFVGWGELKFDRNIEDGDIKLIVGGKPTKFDKGIGAHATSSVVYDISKYSNEFNKLVTYAGIDASKGANGNGAYVIIYTSEDGEKWKEVKRTGVLKGNTESVLLDIDLEGAKYLMLHANHNGHNGYDHIVYGDAKLVKELKQEVVKSEEEATRIPNIAGFEINAKLAEQSIPFKELNNEESANFALTKFPFKIKTDTGLEDADLELDLVNYEFEVSVNGEKAEYREAKGDFYVDGLSLSLSKTKSSEEHELTVKGLDEEGKALAIEEGEYDIKVSVGNVSFDASLTVEEDVPESVEAKELYLSDLKYDSKQSNTKWKTIQVNKNTDGNTIQLIVDGQRTVFEKGMGAHATSNLVYDISDYTKEYTRLVTYMGVNATQGGNGNGVKFTISTSENGTTWKEIYNSPVIKGNQESLYVDLKLDGAKFIKLHANDNGSNGNDHSVYGDLKLVTDAYTLSAAPIENLKTVAEYDAILSKNTVEENMKNHKMDVMRRDLIKRIGYESIQRIAGKSVEHVEAINYLMNNEAALTYYITGGKVTKDGSEHRALTSFIDIYTKHKDELLDPADNNFNLRLAVSTSLAYAHTELVRFWMASSKPISAVNRYEEYQDLVASGKMDQAGATENYEKWSTQQFKGLPIPLMRWVVDNRINDDEIDWLADYALKHKEVGNQYSSAYNYITYTGGYNYNNPELYDLANKEKFNEKYGNFLDYFDTDDYGTAGITRLWMIFEEGSVCGGLAKTYSNLADVFGRPSSVVGQPGHAATMTWGWSKENQRYEWMLQNDISGWSQSGNEYNDRLLNWGNKSFANWHGASYNILATDAVLDKNYQEVALLNLLAESYDNAEAKKEVYEKALALQGINLDSMEGLVYAYKNTGGDLFSLAKRIVSTYTYYPQTMMELLTLIQGQITNPTQSAELDVLKRNALLSASKATKDVSTNVSMSKQLANKYLNGNQATALATFSFSGENAGKIVLDSKYDGSDIRVKYSLDGGTEWKQSDKHVIELTKEELASITAENDIIVGLVGGSDNLNHRIDITAGTKINKSVVYMNDDENLLLGAVANLEFSYDGNVWCDYVTNGEVSINPNGVTGIRFDGDTTIKLRYKANGTQLQSDEVEYKFTANQETDERKYVQLKDVKVVDSSAQHGGREAKKALDGTVDTNFHTPFGKVTDNKFLTVKFDKPRYITSIESLFGGGNNGRLQDGYIQVSQDGKEWTTVKTITGMARNAAKAEYKLDKPVKAQYVKVVATKTHGNNNSETDMYFCIGDLKFYEGTTIDTSTPMPLPLEEDDLAHSTTVNVKEDGTITPVDSEK